MANSEIILVDASIEVNDETVTVEANTIVIVEGQGESSVKAATNGGTGVVVISQDVMTRIGMVKFEMPASVRSMNLSRDFKALTSGSVVRVSGTDPSGMRLGRTLNQAVMTNDPEKQIANEGKVAIEFSGAPLVTS